MFLRYLILIFVLAIGSASNATKLDLSLKDKSEVLNFDIPATTSELKLDAVGLSSDELALIKLPKNLKLLSLAYNDLETLPPLPNSIETLIINENPLKNNTSIIYLPENLKKLEIIRIANASSGFMINNILFPDTLETIVMGASDFGTFLRRNKLPKSLKRVIVGKNGRVVDSTLEEAEKVFPRGSSTTYKFIKMKPSRNGAGIYSYVSLRDKTPRKELVFPAKGRFIHLASIYNNVNFSKAKFGNDLKVLKSSFSFDEDDLANLKFPLPTSLEILDLKASAKCRSETDTIVTSFEIPTNVRSLNLSKFCLRSMPELPVNLKSLTYNDNYFTILPELPETLERVEIDDTYLDIENMHFSGNIKSLVLKKIYRLVAEAGTINPIQLPQSIEELDLSRNHLVLSSSFFTNFPNLVNLKFGYERSDFGLFANLPIVDISRLVYPDSLESLDLIGLLNQDQFNRLVLPKNLKHLKLTFNFRKSDFASRKSIDFSRLKLPDSLESLELDVLAKGTECETSLLYRDSLQSIKFPDNLKNLRLKLPFGSLEGLSLPNKLEKFEIRNAFCSPDIGHDFGPLVLPGTLKSLIIDLFHINNLNLSNNPNLEYLAFGIEIDKLPELLPDKLKILDLRTFADARKVDLSNYNSLYSDLIIHTYPKGRIDE